MCIFLYLVVFVVFFLFCSVSFSALMLLVGSHRVELSFLRSWGRKFPGDYNIFSSVCLVTYKKVTISNGVSFMQTNISVSFTVISEL